MGLRIQGLAPRQEDFESNLTKPSPLKMVQPSNSMNLDSGFPAIHTSPKVITLDPFALRKIPPTEFNKVELKALYFHFFKSFEHFTIYFFDDAIDEKYGFPIHLKNIGNQLISYYRYNLIVAPRGFSKSTIISGIYPIREIVYHMKEYIVIVSETMDIAQDFTELIRHELEQNYKISHFFGKFRSKKTEEDSTEKWTVSDLICSSRHPVTKRAFSTRVRARGLGQQIRGKKHRHQRPDLLIFDDVESRGNTDTDSQRIKAKIWFNRDALKIMDRYDAKSGKGQVVVAGTIVHPESRLNRLKKNVDADIRNDREPIWKMQFYKAAEESSTCSKPLWPERFSSDYLLKERKIAAANDDLPGFLQEFFNEPVVEEDRKFKPEYFIKRYQSVRIEKYYGQRVLMYEGHRYPVRLSAGLDIGGWEDRGSDKTAIVVGAQAYDPLRDIYQGFVLEAYDERWNPDQIIDYMFDISERYNHTNEITGDDQFLSWTVETNAFQTLLYHFLNREMRRRNKYSVHISHMDHETANKRGRILSLVPVFKTRHYIFGEHLSWLVQRFIDYGMASDMHDDVEDAFQKMHRNLAMPNKDDDVKAIKILKPMYTIPVEPKQSFKGNWITG